jgi:hypothetical protein
LDVALPWVGAVVVAGAIVVASRLDVGTEVVAGAVGAWVGAAAVEGALAVPLPAVDTAGEVGDAATTMDGLRGDGVWSVSYGATVGVSHGADDGVYGTPITTPADMVTNAAVAMPAFADRARPPNQPNR